MTVKTEPSFRFDMFGFCIEAVVTKRTGPFQQKRKNREDNVSYLDVAHSPMCVRENFLSFRARLRVM